MKRVTLGDGALSVSAIAFGCWRFLGDEPPQARAKIDAVGEAGLNFLDTADIYGFGTPGGFGAAETQLGAVFKDAPHLREEFVVATKGGVALPKPYDASFDYLVGACEASLERLNTEYVDLYQVHRPDLLASAEETARALNHLLASGKAKTVGVSNYTPAQFRALQAHLDAPLVSHQPEFSAWEVSPLANGILDQCQETGAACLAWSPLAGGRLATGDVSETDDAQRFAALIATLDRLAEAYNASRTQIALAFLTTYPAKVIAIIGSQTPARIQEAADAVHISLSRRDWYDVYEARLGSKMP